MGQMTPEEIVAKYVVHCKVKSYDAYVGRGQGSHWGNPYTHLQVQATCAEFQVKDRDEAVKRHRDWFLSNPQLVAAAKKELKGKVLGCWCYPKRCHAEILAIVANSDQWPDFGFK